MNDETNPRGFFAGVIEALAMVSVIGLEAAKAATQQEIEAAVLAHVRNQPHNQTICTSCAPTVPATQIKDCTKHDFGTCVVDCRYRTGFPGKCTKEKDWPYTHGDGNCKPDCYGRP